MYRAYLRRVVRVIDGWGWKNITSFTLAVLFPLTIFTIAAMNRPISFDGAMNLQVAQNVSENGQYSRNYARKNNSEHEKLTNTSVFPNEVETNGPYILTSALGIKIFGQTQFGFQFSNIFYIFGLAVLIWWILKRWLFVATLAPAVVLLILPARFDATLGGYGEMPALFFAVLAIVLVAHSATKKDKSSILKFVSLALLAAGAAVSTKTYLVGFVPALLLGIIFVKYSKNIPYRSLIKRLPFAVVVPAIMEVWHFASLGSVYEYIVWWKHEIKAVLLQAGLRDSGDAATATASGGLFDKVSGQLDVLNGYAVLAPAILLLVVFLAISICLIYYKKLDNKLFVALKFMSSKHGLLLIMLFSMFATYYIWWMILLPESKTFIRRTMPIMLPIEIVLAILVAAGTGALASIRSKMAKPSRHLDRLKALGAFMCISAIVFLIANLAPSLEATLEKVETKPFITINNYEDTANEINRNLKDRKIYGVGWWSSPVISLMSDHDFYNLDLIEPCEINPNKDLVIWDKMARAITKSTTPIRSTVFKYELYLKTEAASFYRLSPIKKCNS